MHYRWSPRNVTSVLGVFATTAIIGYIYLGLYEILGAAPLIVLLLLAAISGGWWIAETVWEHRHRGDLQAFAEHVGWEYLPYTSQYRLRFRSYPFNQGTDREDVDVLRGTLHGRQCASYTRRYDAGSNDSNAILSFQITMVELPVRLPTVDIVPVDAMSRVTSLLGGAPITFESAKFNRHWRVKSNDARYAHALLHPRMLHRLNSADAYGYAIRFEERAVLMWRAERAGTEDLARRLGVLTALANLVPPHLEREYLELELEEERVAAQMLAAQEQAERGAPLWAREPGALTSGYHRAQQALGKSPDVDLTGPAWAITPGALTQRRYTGLDQHRPDSEG